MRDIKYSQIKLKVIDTFKKDEKITTNFENSDDSDFVKRASINKEVLTVFLIIERRRPDLEEAKDVIQ